MGFELFQRRSRAASSRPTVGIQNKGTVSLNAAAFNLLRECYPEPPNMEDRLSVQFLYDKAREVVGFKPVSPETKDSYPVRRQPQSKSYLLSGTAFFAYHGINTESVRRFVLRRFNDTIAGFSLLDDEIK